MSSGRQDYLGSQCELGGLSIPDFQTAFCGRCSQAECTRSLFGKTSFDQRVQNWHNRLFAAPTMVETDPRFELISGQKFVSIDVSGPAHISSAWLDPSDLPESKAALVNPAPVQAAEPSTPVQTPQAATQTPRRALPVLNTPFQSGAMIGVAPAAVPTKDPWAAPGVPERPKETVVAPGGKIKLGGGSGV